MPESTRRELSSDPSVIGRAGELQYLASRLEGMADGGAAVVIEGEPGIGKTALLRACAREAESRGFRVLRAVGVQGTNAVGFDALHQVLHPLLPYVSALPERQRGALLTAFALQEGPVPDQLLIRTAALGLLEEAAAHRPIFVEVEDLHWVDRSSANVLQFIGLRLTDVPVVIVATERPPGVDTAYGFERLTLGPLQESAAGQLLDEIAPDLPPLSRSRILAEADGNALALSELPQALRRAGGLRTTSYARLPTTRRLEQVFVEQLRGVPPRSLELLLLAAVADDAALYDVMAAGRLLDLTVDDLAPLEVGGLVTATPDTLQFRHPLLRSAVIGSVTAADSARAHRALAAVVEDPGRAAWHRASATYERDESVASELEAAAGRAQRRGARPEAVRAYERAAALSQGSNSRARRLALGAETARAAGMTLEAVQLLEQVEQVATEPETVTEAAITRVVLSLTTASPGPASEDIDRITALLDGPAHVDRLVKVLWGASSIARGRNLPVEEWRRIEAHLHALQTENPLKQVALGLLAPHGEHPNVRALLPHLVPQLRDFPLGMVSLAIAAESLQDLDTALTCWELGYELAHDASAAADEAQAMRGRATVRLLRGRVRDALEDAEYAARMAQDTEQPLIGGLASATIARANALLGNIPAAQEALRAGSALTLQGKLAVSSADARWAAGTIAMHERRYRDAFVEFTHMAVHPTRSLWTVADRTEAAKYAGRIDTVRDNVAEAEDAARAYRSSYLSALVFRSKALLAGDTSDAEESFHQAITAGQMSESPLELARTQLAFGEWLRRERRVVEARFQLSEALREFDASGVVAYADRAAAELRAAGEAPNRPAARRPDADALTPQELQVARLAAAGMSNKAIADRIYLSHRTVSTHLYKLFPKLGVTTRAQLAAALTAGGYTEREEIVDEA